MKIVLATPLYPPDIAEPAPYVKELAKRLAPMHEITVATYGRLPEQVAGATVLTADKRALLPVRLARYTALLWRVARGADIVYIQNGPSVELPVAVLMVLMRRPLFMRLGDVAAHQYAQAHFVRRALERFVMRRVQVVAEAPPLKPEILPFENRPTAALAAWEESWDRHIEHLQRIFAHAS